MLSKCVQGLKVLTVVQVTVAESPAQLMLEAAAAKQWGDGNPPSKLTEPTKAASPVVLNGPVRAEVLIKPVAAATDAGIQNGSLVSNAAVRAVPSPVKQTEYRRADGRRRIIPEPLGPAREDLFGNGVTHSSANYDVPKAGMPEFRNRVDDRREDVGRGVETGTKRSLPEECVRADVPPSKRSSGTALDEACAPAARSSPPEIVTVGLASAGQANAASVQQVDMVIPAERTTTPAGVLSYRIRAPVGAGGQDDKSQAPVCLEARPAEASDNMGSLPGSVGPTLIRETSAKAEIVCSQGGEVRWRDHLASMPTALAGNSNFWAVACGDGSLQVLFLNFNFGQPSCPEWLLVDGLLRCMHFHTRPPF